MAKLNCNQTVKLAFGFKHIYLPVFCKESKVAKGFYFFQHAF
jgi:hypothetical protein